MKRLLASIRADVLRQSRYGLYAVSVVVVLIWGALLSLVADGASGLASKVVPAFLAVNLIITTFYFMAALVLIERGEGMLAALTTTPLRDGEYLLSKGASLTLLAVGESVLVVVFLFGAHADWWLLASAATALGLLYTWSCFLVVLRYESINAFLMPSALFVTAFTLPLLSHFDLVGRWAFAWHPVEPAMTIMRAAYGSGSGLEIAYGLAGMVGWTVLAFAAARRQLARFAAEAAW